MMDHTLPLYETMSRLSAEMLEAARENDWDRFCLLETETARLRAQLISRDPYERQAGLDEPSKARKIELIRQVLENDREIRTHTEPWLESVRALLSGGARQRALHHAYGLHSG
jgi:flagellar protein FliT